MTNNVSRRDLLKGLGIGAAGAGLFGLTSQQALAKVLAQTTPVAGAGANVYTTQLGDITLRIIKDGAFTPNAAIFGANQDEADVIAAFDAAHTLNPDNTVNMLFSIMVAQFGDETVLFDTGFGPGGGALVETLGGLGIAVEDVTGVLMSHFHPDHINGLSNDDGLVYPNAAVYFPQTEFDFLQNAPSDVSGAPLGKLQPALDAEQVTFFGDGEELVPGITAMATPGHTPGHTAWMLTSGDNSLIHIVDSILRYDVHIPNPGWFSQFDADGALAAESRTALMTMAAEEGIPLFGYHWSFPGIGYVDADGDGFRYTPVAF